MHCPRLNELPPPPAGKTGWPWTKECNPLPEYQANGEPWPKVSIVTPSYNQGEFIEETIRSILLQGYPSLEYIIIDGKSNDTSIEVIQKYEAWLKFWVSEPDRGQAHAINKGFSHVSGNILAWMNSDDTYEPGAISAVAQKMSDEPKVDVLYGNVHITDEVGRLMTKLRSVPFDSQAFLYETVHIAAQSAVFWRHELQQLVGPVKEELHYSMDRELLIRFIEYGAEFKFLRRTLGTYRCHSGAKTSSDKSRIEMLKIPMMAHLISRRDYPIWRAFYRLRQWGFLLIQGDMPYILSRAIARFRPTEFDQQGV